MPFSDYTELSNFFVSLGVTRSFFKPLSENDNTKQQIYLGGSFQTLNQIPFGRIRVENESGKTNYKAAVELWWVTDTGETALAPHTQLILYPKYPEVRLSGFIRECPVAPSGYLQPVQQKHRTGFDGRILIFGITILRRVYAFLAPPDSPVARSIISDGLLNQEASGVFLHFPLGKDLDGRKKLISRLREIIDFGWHSSRRLDKHGNILQYKAQNGGGYTLEALLGIIPNGISEPDFMGWELKAFSQDRITLMTPEPDSGYYGEKGVEAFVRRFGHDAGNDTLYFTGVHKAASKNESTGMILQLQGFDLKSEKITDPSGGIALVTEIGDNAAKWSFGPLLEHWGRKHAQTAYIKFSKQEIRKFPHYSYSNRVWFGEDTNFSMFLKGLAESIIFLDPASKIMAASTLHSKVKARSQFRIIFRNINRLYGHFIEFKI